MKLTDEQLAHKCEEFTGELALAYVATMCADHRGEPPQREWFEYNWNIHTRVTYRDIRDTIAGRGNLETRLFESCYDDLCERVKIIVMMTQPMGLERLVAKVLSDEAHHQAEVDPIERSRAAFDHPTNRGAAALVANLAGKLRDRWMAGVFAMKEEMLFRYARSHTRHTWSRRDKARKLAEVKEAGNVH